MWHHQAFGFDFQQGWPLLSLLNEHTSHPEKLVDRMVNGFMICSSCRTVSVGFPLVVEQIGSVRQALVGSSNLHAPYDLFLSSGFRFLFIWFPCI